MKPRRSRTRILELLTRARNHFRRAGVQRMRTIVAEGDVPLLSLFRANGFVRGSFVQLEYELGEPS